MEKLEKRKRVPGKRCVVMFCDKTNADYVSLHQFPSDKKIRAKWVRFVLQKRDPKYWTPGSGYVCSDHFAPEDYDGYHAKQAGFASKLVLRKDAVPSINPTAKKAKLSSEASNIRPINALTKIHAHRTLEETSKNEQAVVCKEVYDEPHPANEATIERSLCKSCDKATQKSLRKPERRSIGIEVATTQRDVAIQCDLSPAANNVYVQNQNSDEETSDDTLDRDYVPSTDSDEDMDDSHVKHKTIPSNNKGLYYEKKFIVFESCLLSLFKTCPVCGGDAKGSVVETVGTLVRVKHQCADTACSFSKIWSSQPNIRRMPIGNLLLSTCILLSGCCASKVLRMFGFMNVACLSSSSYFRHARSYINPTVIQFWCLHKQHLIDRLKGMDTGLVVAGDERCDSPGHSAKFGSYTMIEQQVNKVVHFELIQSNEVKNSTWMEKEGLVRSVNAIRNAQLEIDEIITDRHKQTTPWIKRNLPNAKHYFDIWHVSKGLCKKIDKLAKSKKYSDLGQWRDSISNHMYWCAASTQDGDGEKMKEKWKILPLHIQNIHVNPSSPLHKECGHGILQGDARNRLWITPGSEMAVKMEELLLKKNLLNAIANLSPKYQTSTLEAKHSLDTQFVPKHNAFSYWGMYTRLCISAIHYNTNSERMQKVSKDGRAMYAIRFPKSKKGKHSVRPIKTDPTYEYCFEIIESLFVKYQTEARALKLYMKDLQVNTPPPLSANANRPDKDEAILNYVTRYYQSAVVH